jgi:transcriptional regulator with PAS, ATPase and Fis domain
LSGRDSQTLRELQSEDVPEDVSKSPYLFLVLECERPEVGGARYSLAEVSEVRIGRGDSRGCRRIPSESALALEVRDGWMSSAHARIVSSGGRWVFEDLGSTNGSSVDGVTASTSPLQDGAVVTLGHTIFIFREAMPRPRDQQADADFSDLTERSLAFSSLLPLGARDLAKLERMAKSELSILLLGDTGTGKELLARAIHATSARTGALVAVNCGALPESLVESQFFGHEKGAFSGAHREAPGFFRAADRGTLFLDEVGDLRGPAQAALLRVLQEHEVTPVGSVRAHKVDIRVVSATHRPLDALAGSDGFRSDLLARLSGYRHLLPPLRQRREDLGLIYAGMMRERAAAGQPVPRLAPDSARALLNYAWPGNIRQLRHVVAASAVLSDGAAVQFADLPPEVRNPAAPAEPKAAAFTPEAQQSLRDRFVQSLQAHGGNVTAVAEAMRTSRSQVYRWLKRFEIDLEQFARTRKR